MEEDNKFEKTEINKVKNRKKMKLINKIKS